MAASYEIPAVDKFGFAQLKQWRIHILRGSSEHAYIPAGGQSGRPAAVQKTMT